MKKELTIIILCFVSVFAIKPVYSQTVNFDYDASGNCIIKYKTIVLGPSFIKRNSTPQDTIPKLTEKGFLGEREITIFPNPTKGFLKVEISGIQPQTPMIYILSDTSGRLIKSEEITTLSFNIDMTKLPTAVYYLTILFDNKQDKWKIVRE